MATLRFPSLGTWRVLLAVAMATAVSLGASAQEGGTRSEAAPFTGIATYEKQELAGMRAGFITAAGLEIDIGATVRTFVDGTKVMETVLTMTDPNAPARHLVPAPNDDPGFPGLTFIRQDGQGTASLSRHAGIDIPSLSGLEGLVLNRGGEGTAIALYRIGGGTILNFVAAGGAAGMLEQQLDIDITVRNFTAFQQNAGAIASLSRLIDAWR